MSSSSSYICIPTKIIQFIIVLLYINIIYALTLSSSIFNNNSHPSNVITVKPKPRKCHMIHQITANNTNNNMKSKCKKIKDNFSPSLSFLRNTNCYKGTYTHDPPIPDELKNEKTNRKKIIELHLHSFYSRHHFNHNNFVFMNKEETNMNNVPTLLSHRFETMPYNKILKQYINAFNQELDHIIETKQHSNPFHIDGHIRTFYPKIPNNVFDILNVCGNNNITSTSSSSSNNNNNTKEKNDLEHFPKLTLLLKQIVNKIEEMTWNMFQNNFMKNHQLEKEHHNDHLRCFELFASHTNIETVNLHCDTANTYQKNIQIVAWVPLYNVIMNPLIIKDNGGTETSLCDDDVLTDVHDGNNNNIFYTTSGMKAGEFLIYLNPSTKENRTMLLNESPFHGSANITQSPIPFHDLKHHRILINMNVFNVDIIHGW